MYKEETQTQLNIYLQFDIYGIGYIQLDVLGIMYILNIKNILMLYITTVYTNHSLMDSPLDSEACLPLLPYEMP